MPFSIRRVLCPVDFSSHSARALRYALALGEWYGARVSVLHVSRLPEPAFVAASFPGPVPMPRRTLSGSDRDRLASDLREFVMAEASARSDVEWRVEEAEDVSRAITTHASALQADLIVMSTHGRSGFRRFLLGSIAERVMRTAARPVLIVPPGATDAKPGCVCCERIVCATDFSEGAAVALEYAASLARHANATLTVAHIIEMPGDLHDYPTIDIDAFRTVRFARAGAALMEAVKPLHGFCRVEELLLAGRASTEIVRLAQEQQADLIVIGVHGRGVVDLTLFGSVADQVIRRTTVPVLAVPSATIPH